MKPYLPCGLADSGPALEQLEPEGIYMSRLQLGFFGVTPEEQEKTVFQRVHQESELIGFEAVTAEAVGLELVFQFLNPVLGLAPLDVYPVIDNMGHKVEVGHDKALIEPFFQALDLGHYPSAIRPGNRPSHATGHR